MTQSSADCATILKRGYLHDKKGGLRDRKRWYILRQSIAEGYCVLETYKDEKTASKGEAPKGFINVHDVVEVKRVPEKKQTFEILCPGVGYKLTANSEVETDEWMESLKRLILYRKDEWKSQSLKHSEMDPSSPLTIAPSQSHSLPYPFTHHSPPESLMIPLRSASSSSLPIDAPLSHSPQRNFHHNLPTPPESISSPPIPTLPPATIQRQRSTEFVPPLPSPPSSSDSSSMCSGSNASFDAQSAFDPEAESRSRFRVQVKESEGLNITGPVDLIVVDDAIALHSVQTGQQLVSWPIGSLRRYGVNSVCFTIVTGRYCSTGEGKFQFFTQNSRLIHSKVHAMAVQKANAIRKTSELTTSIEVPSTSSTSALKPLPTLQTTPRHQSYQTQLQQGTNLSPPVSHYTHIEHPLVPPATQDQYDKIAHGSPSSTVLYNRLNHDTCSFPSTKPISTVPPANTSITGSVFTQPQVISQVQLCPCAHCAPRQVPLAMAAPGTLQGMNVTGQMMYLSSSPFHHHPAAAFPSPHSSHQHTFTPSHITASHLPPHIHSHGVNHAIVTTSYAPGAKHSQPHNPKSRSFSNDSSCPDFTSYHGERNHTRAKPRAHSITAPTLL